VCQFSSAPENIQKQVAFFAALLCRLKVVRQRLLQLAGVPLLVILMLILPIQQRPRKHPKTSWVFCCVALQAKLSDSVCRQLAAASPAWRQ